MDVGAASAANAKGERYFTLISGCLLGRSCNSCNSGSATPPPPQARPPPPPVPRQKRPPPLLPLPAQQPPLAPGRRRPPPPLPLPAQQPPLAPGRRRPPPPVTQPLPSPIPVQQPVSPPAKRPPPAPVRPPPPPPPRGNSSAGGNSTLLWVDIRPLHIPGLSMCVAGRSSGAEGDASPVVQRPCDKGAAQQFRLVVARGYWKVVDGYGRCMGVAGSAGKATVSACAGGGAGGSLGQQFSLEAVAGAAGNVYRLRPRSSAKCLGMRGGEEDGAVLVQTACTGAADQSFLFGPF